MNLLSSFQQWGKGTGRSPLYHRIALGFLVLSVDRILIQQEVTSVHLSLSLYSNALRWTQQFSPLPNNKDKHGVDSPNGNA